MHSGKNRDLSEADQLRYRRQSMFAPLGESGQAMLASSRVAVVGAGALGSVIAERLTRAGVGMLRIIDRDWVELDNLPRQSLYTESDVEARLPKAVAAKDHLTAINRGVHIEAYVEDITHLNIERLLADFDLVMDGTDNFETRFLINDLCLETKTAWVHGGCLGASGQVIALVPGKTVCFRCIMPDAPGPAASGTCDSVGVLGPAVSLVASWQCVEAIKLLCDAPEAADGGLWTMDLWSGQVRKIQTQKLRESGSCPACLGSRDFLRGRSHSETTVMCGRNSVQINPESLQLLDLAALAQRLASIGQVQANAYLIRMKSLDYSMTVFRDGRAVIHGTEDPAIARTLYAKWIGC